MSVDHQQTSKQASGPSANSTIVEIIEESKRISNGLHLNLALHGLVSVPRQVNSLSRLRFLNLRNNQLTMIPADLCDALRELESLNLSYNRVQYLPQNIVSMTRLQNLNLQNNELCELPEGLGRLKKLKELRVEFNALGSLPASIVRLEDLTTLTMSHNRITAIPRGFSIMQSLQSLDLSENPLDYENLPADVSQLNEMYRLLHSKSSRKFVVQRANCIRTAIRNQVRKELFEEHNPGLA